MNRFVSKVMKDNGLDAIVFTNHYNIRYLTGYTGDTGILLLTAKKGFLLTDFRYIFQAENEAKDVEVEDVAKNGYTGLMKQIFADNGVKTAGFEGEHTLFSELSGWKKKCRGVKFVDVDAQLSELRIIKTPEELEKLRMAEHIGDLAFEDILKYLKPGVTELEIAARLEFSLKMHGAEAISFDPIVASGVNSSMPHAIPSGKKIEKGDFVTMDFGCKYQGYCSDMTRTVVVGKASDKQKKVYNKVLEAQLAVLSKLKPGLTGVEIDKIARDIIDASEFKGSFGHGLGHGVGLYIHETPNANARYDKKMKAGMTLTDEPGIYLAGFGGVRIEDMGAFTAKGFENFAKSPKELIEL
ncbi:MAG: aminopeptidase P family protein [Lachnospiraceae bacterium]|nr:aminopeptidase P family protein [Lachnospiraceae bacterium]